MNQALRILLPFTVISSLAVMMQCANPVDEPPLRWESKVQVPISNKDFNLKKEFDNLFSWDSMAFVDKNPAEKDSGDTMIFSIHRSSADTFETHEDSLKSQKFVFRLGPIPIAGAAQFQKSSTVIAAPGPLTLPLTFTLDSIYSIDFYDTVTNKIPIVVTNSSAATLSNIIINAGNLGIDTITSISPNQSDTAWLPVNGKQCTHSVSLTMSATKSIGAGTVTLAMNVNGLTASSIKADDNLIHYSYNIQNPYEITDTVDIDYIDITEGKFIYSITNNTGVAFNLNGTHDNLWTTSFCALYGLTKSEDLASLTRADSGLYYSGKLNGTQLSVDGSSKVVEIPIDAHSRQELLPKDVGAKRLFPTWDSTLQKSVTIVKYNISTPTPNDSTIDTITLSSKDSITFEITTPTFKFYEFLGTTTEEYNRSGDTQKIFIDVPWPQSAQDSLRGRFILSNVTGDVFVSPNMPEGSFIDTMVVNFVTFSPDSISLKDSTTAILTNVNKDSTFNRTIDLTDVTNLFPDTLLVSSHMRIPRGTRMKVVNDLKVTDPVSLKYIGRMQIYLNTSYFLNSDLDWEITDTVRMDLGSGKFKVPQELRYVSKLEEKQASFLLRIKNQSNLNMYIYSLLAPQPYMQALDSIDGNELTYLIDHPDSAAALGFVSFIDGVYIPLRDSTFIDTVKWVNDELNKIVDSDSCSWRWQLRFLPKNRDALRDVDYLRINSSLRVEGINNMDSLLIW